MKVTKLNLKIAAATSVAVLASATSAWAGQQIPQSVPEPGILGLVAVGIVAAIVVSRRKK
jgi:PEP-CTERM motif-containing protein